MFFVDGLVFGGLLCLLFVCFGVFSYSLGLVFAVWAALLVRVVFCVGDCGIVLR